MTLLPAFEILLCCTTRECAAGVRGRAEINTKSFLALFIYMTLKMMSVHNVEHDGEQLTGQSVLATAEQKQNYRKISIVKLLRSISLISIVNQGKTFDPSCTFTRDKWAFDENPAGCPAFGSARGCLDLEVRLNRAWDVLAAWCKRRPLSRFPAQQGIGTIFGQIRPGFNIVKSICKSIELPNGYTHAISSPGLD